MVPRDTDYTGCKLFVSFLSPPNKMLKSDHCTLPIHSGPSFSNDSTILVLPVEAMKAYGEVKV